MNAEYGSFTDEKAALEEIASAGYFPLTLNFSEENSDLHWHDFDSLVYVLDGEVKITDGQTDEVYVCGAGTRISAPGGLLHREETKGYKAIIGFAIDPAQLSQPINKKPPVVGQ
jgi:hypothetical protein